MRPGTILVLLAAILLGTIAAYGARILLLDQPGPVSATAQTTIVVASQPVTFGVELNDGNLAEIGWGSAILPEGAFRTKEELLKAGKRMSLASISKGEPVLSGKVTGPGQRASLAALIEPGMRAVTIRVDDVRGVAGFVLPNDRVDIILTRSENGNQFADVLLQSVKVLAIDQVASERQANPTVARAVTVEVNTQQAQKLVLASGVGSLSLVLQQAGVAQNETARRVTMSDLGDTEVANAESARAREMSARIEELKKLAENSELKTREAYSKRIAELETNLQTQLKSIADRYAEKPTATVIAPAPAPAPASNMALVRVTRGGGKQEDYSVSRDLR